jgi:hypothetical protein
MEGPSSYTEGGTSPLCYPVFSSPVTAVIPARFLPDFTVIDAQKTADVCCVAVFATRFQRPCPAYGRQSMRVHSCYTRRVRDLQIVDQTVRLSLHIRRFFCDDDCPRRIIAERLPDLAPERVCRAGRLTNSLRAVGFATGGEASARLATCLRMPT